MKSFVWMGALVAISFGLMAGVAVVAEEMRKTEDREKRLHFNAGYEQAMKDLRNMQYNPELSVCLQKEYDRSLLKGDD